MELAEPLRRARDAHRAGRLDEARRGYEEALAADANNADALHLLGVLNHQSGDAAAAIDFVNRAIDARPGFAEALNNRGAFHQAAGDLAAAMDDFQAAVHIDANFADAWLNLGCLTRVRDGADAALAPLRSAVTAAPEMVEALDALGECLGALGRRDEALVAFERALAVDATHAATLCNKGKVLNDIGRFADAVRTLEAAVARQPDLAEAWNNLGNAHAQFDDLEGAVDAYGRAVACRPNFAIAQMNLARALEKSGRIDDAIDAYRQAAEWDSCAAEAYVGLAALHLGRGDASAALRATDDALATLPGNTTALAHRGTALIALDRIEDAGRLNRLQDLVDPAPVAVPPGFADVAAFNDALAAHILAHPSLTEDPTHHATRNGRHSGELLAEPLGPMAAFRDMVLARAAMYREHLDSNDSHPFIARRPDAFKLTAWAVVMRAEGHQVAHIHGSSWLSGVYYPRLPAVIDSADNGHAGWIEFGRPPEQASLKITPEVRLVKPVEGLMVLFPSFLYHRTIPYAMDEVRISIAFDVMPV